MLRVAEQYATTDTGRQRRANEDSLLARAPLFVVADGMGGAQAGEVASRIAVESFQEGLDDTAEPEGGLAARADAANARIHELSHSDAAHTGMGTTLTAVYVAPEEVAIAQVGDSRAYCLRDGVLERLTDDHSLVDELLREGKITPAEAAGHPQRSVITRALGPEPAVEIDTRSYRARAGDVYLLCSDGLTTMIKEDQIAELLLAHPHLRDAGEALIAAANEAGGRDNITVVLFRLEEALAAAGSIAGGASSAVARRDDATGDGALTDTHPTLTGIPAQVEPVSPRRPRHPSSAKGSPASGHRRRVRRAGVVAVVLTVLGLIGAGAYLAFQSVYFIGTNARGLVTLYNGVPYQLPGPIKLYSSDYVSGVSASTLSPEKRHSLLDQTLRSEGNGAARIHSLELEQLE